MNNNNKDKDSQERVTDNIYELNFFNSNGIINKDRVKSHLVLILLIVFLVSNFTLFSVGKIVNNDIPSHLPLSFEFFYELFNGYINLYTNSVIEYFSNNIIPPDFIINQVIVSLSLAMLTSLLFFYFKVYKPSKFQAALSSAGLSQYYFHKKKNQVIYLKFKKGQKNAFKDFITQKDNLAQMLGFENIQFKRWEYNGIMMQYSNKFPTLNELSSLKVEDYLKENSLFLGIGLPMVGEKYNKKELVLGKYLPRYLNFSDIPVGTGNLGSAGGGKSNTMNQYLYSIFNNFNKIERFYFIDFKGGIEAQPILDLENKYKTGKIQVFDDNRIGLYKVLKLLYFINKARMRYLRANKKKKFTNDFIVLLFDELAEILDFTPASKEDKFIQEKINFYIESLLRTGRSQGFKIFYSTQSYLSTASGLSSGMKNNTKLKVAHQLGSKLQVGSIKPVEELEELFIDPTNYDVGKNVVINEADNTIYEVRSLYVPDDFINSVKINNKNNSTLEKDMKYFYKEIYTEMKNDLESSGSEDDIIYPITDIAKELKIKVDTKDFIEVDSKNSNSNIHPKQSNTKRLDSKPKLDIAKKIKAKKIEKASKDKVDKFLNTPKYKDKDIAILKENQILDIKNEINSITPKTPNDPNVKNEIDSFLSSLK
jgi:hypothetical protein